MSVRPRVRALRGAPRLFCTVACAGLVVALSLASTPAAAQIDPVRRDLVEFGYDRPLAGHLPLALYTFYYMNRPQFLDADHALRLAIAPTYLDGEWATRDALGANTDVALDFQGGAFAADYDEMRAGRWFRDQSFKGYDGGVGVDLYHLFNPGRLVPLYGIVRGGFRYFTFDRDSETGARFVLPHDQPVASLRLGLRFGGQEPVLVPDRAAEISVWYDDEMRMEPGTYGYDGDRRVQSNVQRFLARALLMYTLADSGQRFSVQAAGGASVHPDRLSAFRLGGTFTMSAEFPFAIPGYAENELSARNFVLLGGDYSVPIDAAKRWRVGFGASVAHIDATPGLEQPHAWNTGASATLGYQAPSRGWRGQIVYGHAFDAIRHGRRGADSVSLMFEVDLERLGYVAAGARDAAARTARR
jgi:hypothetical protein